MTDNKEHSEREEVFRKTVIELLHPETATVTVSHSDEQKSNALYKPASVAEPTELPDSKETEGKMYGACPPPPDYEQLEATTVDRTSDLSDSESSSETDEEQAGARRKRHRQSRRGTKRAANDAGICLDAGTPGGKTPKTNLTKNQKRKLKKKRQRAKQRQRHTQSKEFTYEPAAPRSDDEDRPCVDVVALREFLDGVWDVYSREVTSCFRCGDEKETQEHEVFVQLAEKLVQGDVTEDDVSTIGRLKSLVVFNDRTRVWEEITKLRESTSLSEGEKQLLTTLFNYWLTNISVLVKQSYSGDVQPP